MKPSSATLSLLIVMVVVTACGVASPPAAIDTETPPATRTPTALPSPTLTSTPEALPEASATEPLPLAALPVCRQGSGTKLEDLTIAVAAKWDGDDEIYLIQADGSNRVQITFNESRDIEPVWSPEGSQLAYVVNADTEPRLYVSGLDFLEGKILAGEIDAKPGHAALVWSPKGDRLAFKNSEDLFLVDVESGETFNLTRAVSLFPRELTFSPDGTIIAFTAGRPAVSGRFRLYRINVDGTGLKELIFSVEPVFWPDWHPQGDKILIEGIVPGESVGLYVASPDGTLEQLPMQAGSTNSLTAAWSPDGSMVGYVVGFVAVNSDGKRLSRNSIYVATAEGDLDLELVRPPANPDVRLSIHDLVWAPDGRHIAYTTMRGKGNDVGAGQDLFVLDICDGRSTLVVEQIDFYSAPSWRPTP
ncbi:MAG: hypothetical protein ACC700_10375 [Anaerolineales bacterium]